MIYKRVAITRPSFTGKGITGGRTTFPIFASLTDNLSDIVETFSDIYDPLEQIPSVKFIQDIKRTGSPINKKETDNGVGVCFVLFSRLVNGSNSFYIATDGKKHDFAVDYRLFTKTSENKIIHAGKILGKDDNGVIHINDQSGSFHMMIKMEGLDTEFMSIVDESANMIVHRYEDYIWIQTKVEK